jgi:hypothetical protein
MKVWIQKYAFHILVFSVVLVLVLSVLVVKFVFFNDREFKTEASVLVEKVGKHMFLPTNEIPSLATVTDPKKLQAQSFFADAKKGDKVLIYSEAKKAILYDPVADKIVTIAPILLDPSLNTTGGNIENQEF